MSKFFDIFAYLMGKKAGSGGGGGDITVESKSISANGTYTAPSNKAYSPVTVNVPNSYAAGDEGKVVSNGALVAQSSDSVTQNGTVDTTLISSLEVNVPAGTSFTLLAEQDFTVNTSSTTATLIGSINAPGAYDALKNKRNKLLYVRVRDKAGRRNGYFLGVDYFFPTVSLAAKILYAVAATGDYNVSTNQYGVYPEQSVGSSDYINIYSRYSSSSSGTINGVYHVEVYLLDWPDGVSPFTTS